MVLLFTHTKSLNFTDARYFAPFGNYILKCCPLISIITHLADNCKDKIHLYLIFFVMTGSVILSPVCVRLCLSSWLRLAKAFPHERQLKSRGFWELGEGPGWCSRSWSCRQIHKVISPFTVKHTKCLYENMARTEMSVIAPLGENDTLFEPGIRRPNNHS